MIVKNECRYFYLITIHTNIQKTLFTSVEVSNNNQFCKFLL